MKRKKRKLLAYILVISVSGVLVMAHGKAIYSSEESFGGFDISVDSGDFDLSAFEGWDDGTVSPEENPDAGQQFSVQESTEASNTETGNWYGDLQSRTADSSGQETDIWSQSADTWSQSTDTWSQDTDTWSQSVDTWSRNEETWSQETNTWGQSADTWSQETNVWSQNADTSDQNADIRDQNTAAADQYIESANMDIESGNQETNVRNRDTEPLQMTETGEQSTNDPAASASPVPKPTSVSEQEQTIYYQTAADGEDQDEEEPLQWKVPEKALLSRTPEEPGRIHVVCSGSVTVLSLQTEEREIPWHWEKNDIVLEPGKEVQDIYESPVKLLLLLEGEKIQLWSSDMSEITDDNPSGTSADR